MTNNANSLRERIEAEMMDHPSIPLRSVDAADILGAHRADTMRTLRAMEADGAVEQVRPNPAAFRLVTPEAVAKRRAMRAQQDKAAESKARRLSAALAVLRAAGFNAEAAKGSGCLIRIEHDTTNP